MKNRLPLFFLFLISFSAFSQEDAWVYFNAKSNAQSYYDSPLLMLTQRALDRRTNQNIAFDFKDIPITMSYVNQVKSATGITVMAKSKWMNSLHIRGTQTDINALAALSFVDKIDFADKTLNITGKRANSKKANKEKKIDKTQINFAYGSSANQIQMLNGHLLHQQNYTGSGKIIAVLDAGFPGVNTAQPFQRLRDNNQILGGYNFVLRNPDFYTGVSHGTSVLSTMGGYKDGVLVGTAPDASYYLFVTEDDPTENPVEESYWVEAAERADSLGVDIINTSLGYFGDHDNPAYNHTYADMTGDATFISKGANIAFSRGMIIVASAGNEGAKVEPHIGAPAVANDVIAVGAVTSSETLASFSSIGPSFDGRIKPDLMAQGVSAVLSDEFGNISTASGTSFSSPIMAGMIACLWQAFPAKTNQEIKKLVLHSADRYASPNNSFGYGIPDFILALSNGLSLEHFSKNDFLVYPNPTYDSITFTFPVRFDKGTVVIYTVFGQKVLEKMVSNTSPTISLKSLSKGMYLYQFDSNVYTVSGKILKQY